jgi:hypothetical protein
MKFRPTVGLVLIVGMVASCEVNKQALNPPAEGFDMANSDPRAVEIADSIMIAMGGRKNWDNTRYISWNFFGGRDLIWDKRDNKVRIESFKDSITYLVDLDKLKGRVSVRGQEIKEPDSLSKMLSKGKSIWINDSYWLLMPFKLKDTGLTLKYIGEDTLTTGAKCNVLELTFKDIGDTPQNKYRIFVDENDNLVKQWSYYSNARQDSANFTRPWDNYQKYGDILISADRSDGGGPKNVKVDDNLPEKIFTEF